MAIPTPDHPHLEYNLSSQYSISNGLFILMLDTTTTREEIGRSWAVISNDIDIAGAQEQVRQVRKNRN